MKYCVKCGTQLHDDARFCSKCGNPTESKQFENQTEYTQPGNSNPNVHYVIHRTAAKESNSQSESPYATFRMLAKIFMIVGTVLMSLNAVFPLAWCLPMTIYYINKINKGEKVSIAFKICSLIFVSELAGILMLLDTEQ